LTTLAPIPQSSDVIRPAAQPAQSRLLSLDVFRGMLVAGMVLVTNAGDWNAVYWPLKHADWNGWTPTDMIFPSFLFIVGVSMTFSFAARRRRGDSTGRLAGHVALRSLLLILLGLFLNGFPLFDLANLRVPGILQRIGLCYLAAGLFYLAASRNRNGPRGSAQALIVAILVLLGAYWALLTFVPVPGYGAGQLDQAGNLGAYLDRALFGVKHLWFWGGQQWDPEGMLSTMNPIANVLLGILAGEWLRSSHAPRRKVVGLAVAGIALMLAGEALNPLIPINKKIWTDSFMLFSGGFSLLAMALLYWLIDLRGWRLGTKPALIFGSNAILGFALANMLNPLEPLLHFNNPAGHAKTIQVAIVQLLARFMNAYNASFGYALFFVAVNLGFLWIFYRKKIFLRL
jgi:predicted acyltransferase